MRPDTLGDEGTSCDVYCILFTNTFAKVSVVPSVSGFGLRSRKGTVPVVHREWRARRVHGSCTDHPTGVGAPRNRDEEDPGEDPEGP